MYELDVTMKILLYSCPRINAKVFELITLRVRKYIYIL